MNKDNDILMKVLELVKMVEREKINIGNNTKINLSFVFKEIDIDEDGEISGEDLYKYAQKEKMLYSKKECEYFIRFYDKDYSGGLAFEEFMSVFLSLYHNKLNQYMSNNIFLSKENDVKDKEYVITLLNSIFFLMTFLGKTNGIDLLEKNERISKSDFDNKYSNIDKQDREILFSFLDWNKDKYITNDDIKEIFTPFKDNAYTQSDSYQLEIAFTKEKVIEYYRWLCELEQNLEEKRKILFVNEEITVNAIFSLFSLNNNDYITAQNIYDVLKNYNMYIDIKVIDLIFNRINVREQSKLFFEELIFLFLPYDRQVNYKSSFKVTFLSMKESTKKQIVSYLYLLIKSEQSTEDKKEDTFQWMNHIIKIQNIYYVFNPSLSSPYLTKEQFALIINTDSFPLLWNRLTKGINTDTYLISNIIQSLLPYNTTSYLNNYIFLP